MGISITGTPPAQPWEVPFSPPHRPPFVAEVHVTRPQDPATAVVHYHWHLRDITQRKRAEEAL